MNIENRLKLNAIKLRRTKIKVHKSFQAVVKWLAMSFLLVTAINFIFEHFIILGQTLSIEVVIKILGICLIIIGISCLIFFALFFILWARLAVIHFSQYVTFYHGNVFLKSLSPTMFSPIEDTQKKLWQLMVFAEEERGTGKFIFSVEHLFAKEERISLNDEVRVTSLRPSLESDHWMSAFQKANENIQKLLSKKINTEVFLAGNMLAEMHEMETFKEKLDKEQENKLTVNYSSSDCVIPPEWGLVVYSSKFSDLIDGGIKITDKETELQISGDVYVDCYLQIPMYSTSSEVELGNLENNIICIRIRHIDSIISLLKMIRGA